MFVNNKTTGPLLFPVDHKQTAVIRLAPGWNEIKDEFWFTTPVKLTDKHEIEAFGHGSDTIHHGAEQHVKYWIEKGLVEIKGVVKEGKDGKGKARGVEFSELSLAEQLDAAKSCSDSTMLNAWLDNASDNKVRAALMARLDELKKPNKSE